MIRCSQEKKLLMIGHNGESIVFFRKTIFKFKLAYLCINLMCRPYFDAHLTFIHILSRSMRFKTIIKRINPKDYQLLKQKHRP